MFICFVVNLIKQPNKHIDKKMTEDLKLKGEQPVAVRYFKFS